MRVSTRPTGPALDAPPPENEPGGMPPPNPERAVRWWLWTWAAAWTVIRLRHAGGSWHYFLQGSRLLFGHGPGTGLHLYAAHPDLQIGPLSFLVTTPFRILGPAPSRMTAVVLMSMTGPPLLALIWRLVPPSGRRPSRLALAGLVFLPGWAELVTHAGHLDDALALMLGVVAMTAVHRGRPVATGLLLAAAADCKPWAAAFAPLLLALPRHRWRAAAVCGIGLAAAWLPFVLCDPRTLMATRFTIPTAVSSGLRVLGSTAARTPSWDRPAQLILGCALGTIAVMRGRWQAVILLATAARILLDPEVYSYYTSGVLLGAVAYDLIRTRWRGPWLTVCGLLSLLLVRPVGHLVPISLHIMGLLRVAFVVVAVGAVLAPDRPWPRRHRSRRPADRPWAEPHQPG